jgi:hypothetical protein
MQQHRGPRQPPCCSTQARLAGLSHRQRTRCPVRTWAAARPHGPANEPSPEGHHAAVAPGRRSGRTDIACHAVQFPAPPQRSQRPGIHSRRRAAPPHMAGASTPDTGTPPHHSPRGTRATACAAAGRPAQFRAAAAVAAAAVLLRIRSGCGRAQTAFPRGRRRLNDLDRVRQLADAQVRRVDLVAAHVVDLGAAGPRGGPRADGHDAAVAVGLPRRPHARRRRRARPVREAPRPAGLGALQPQPEALGGEHVEGHLELRRRVVGEEVPPPVDARLLRREPIGRREGLRVAALVYDREARCTQRPGQTRRDAGEDSRVWEVPSGPWALFSMMHTQS